MLVLFSHAQPYHHPLKHLPFSYRPPAMLQRYLKISLVLPPLMLTVSCSNLPFLGGGDDGVSIEPIAPNPAVSTAPAQADNAGDTADFDDPLVESEETPQKPKDPKAVSGLIPLISADAALKLAQAGRKDPFATIALKPDELDSGEESVRTLLPSLPTLPVPPKTQVPAIGPLTPTPPPILATGSSSPGAPNLPVLPQAQPLPELPNLPGPPNILIPPIGPSTPEPVPEDSPEQEPFSPELPPLPEPTLANDLVVTGVITVKGVPHAIVEGPDLKSTYVRAGDSLLNGQVLVKRIEATKGGPALVIFEELGIEVTKQVGESPAGVEILPAES